MFNKKQIEKLLLLANNADDLIELLNTKFFLYKQDIDKKRSIRTFNIDDNIYDFIKKQSKKSGLSLSDVINIILTKSVNLID